MVNTEQKDKTKLNHFVIIRDILKVIQPNSTMKMNYWRNEWLPMLSFSLLLFSFLPVWLFLHGALSYLRVPSVVVGAGVEKRAWMNNSLVLLVIYHFMINSDWTLVHWSSHLKENTGLLTGRTTSVTWTLEMLRPLKTGRHCHMLSFFITETNGSRAGGGTRVKLLCRNLVLIPLISCPWPWDQMGDVISKIG